VAPVLAIGKMVAGIVLNKEGPYPDGEIESVSPPGSGQGKATQLFSYLNSTGGLMQTAKIK
jgi:hypothetical protein